MKKSRRKRKRAPVRLAGDVRQAVSQLAGGTGWSTDKALAFMARAGWNALNSGGDKVAAMRQVMTAAVWRTARLSARCASGWPELPRGFALLKKL